MSAQDVQLGEHRHVHGFRSMANAHVEFRVGITGWLPSKAAR